MDELTCLERKALPQGDLCPLVSDIARDPLAWTESARVAFVAADRIPRVFSMLFHEAVTIDATATSPRAPLVRSQSQIGEIDGIVPESTLALFIRRVLTDRMGILPDEIDGSPLGNPQSAMATR